MFHKEFYPTPRHVLDMMGIECHGKIVFEPHGGKGNIIDYCKEWGASEVLACEINDDLRAICERKATVIGSDFFKVKSDDISHVQLIVMNPPFSNAHRHIMHAWEVAPEGCEIIALCNWETINNCRGYGRTELVGVVENYGEAVNLGDCFLTAERKTGVEVGMVRMFKPKLSDDGSFDDFYLTDDNARPDDEGVISYNEIKAVINSYAAAVRCFERVEDVAKELRAYTNVTILGEKQPDGSYKQHKLTFGDGISFNIRHNETVTTKQQFAREYQRKCWEFIFNRVGVTKYVTKGVMEDINQFIANRKNYPFTMRNIGKMLDIIIGTRSDIMNRAIVEAVDNFTRHTDENRYGVEGWKTNSGHLLNKKFIVGYIASVKWGGGLEIDHFRPTFERITDLVKAICYLTGTKYETIPHVWMASVPKNPDGSYKKDPDRPFGERVLNDNCFEPNKWYDWGFFEFKVYKKGTGHFRFKDENVWAILNRAYAKAKGQVLPEKL